MEPSGEAALPTAVSPGGVEPALSLAFSMQANPGTYALLLGSGVSRAAGILTGWEITLDLVRKLAALKCVAPDTDPASWFRQTYGNDPNYSALLNELARTPAERAQLLVQYFEPARDETGAGTRRPTKAHHAIARLVAKGYVRVILTTNFDRLIESAIEEVGVRVSDLSTDDAINGALPLVHSPCMIVKLNGDYRDTRIKNTPEELAVYAPAVTDVLRRILDEYGLIACGWSADYDIALRGVIESAVSRRFTTYWTVRGDISDSSRRVIAHRRAVPIPIRDADSFFNELAENVRSLEESSRRHPVGSMVVVERLKRYLVASDERIRLQELVLAEAQRVHDSLADRRGFGDGVSWSNEEFEKRLKRYEAITETLLRLLVVGCHWGPTEADELWIRAVDRIANPDEQRRADTPWERLANYPLLLATYAAGLGCIASSMKDKHILLRRIVDEITVGGSAPEGVPLLRRVSGSYLLDDSARKSVPGVPPGAAPLSRRLSRVIREATRDILPEDSRFQEVFDRFEYLYALVYIDKFHFRDTRPWAPIGFFAWREQRSGRPSIQLTVTNELGALGQRWPPIAAGFFQGMPARMQEVKRALDAHIDSLLTYG